MTSIPTEVWKEAINLAIGKTAASLGQMIQSEIFISMPLVSMETVPSEQLEENLPPVSICFNFLEGLEGKLWLMMSKEQADEIARVCIGDGLDDDLGDDLDGSDGPIDYKGVVREFALIFTQHFADEMENILESAPRFEGEGFKSFEGPSSETQLLCTSKVVFDFEEKMQNYIYIVFEVDEKMSFLRRLDDYFSRATG